MSTRQTIKRFALHSSAAALALTIGLTVAPEAHADEADARNLLKAMSDYLAAQETFSFEYDRILELVTDEQQKLALASSGTVTINRPDKIHATRAAGFADVEMLFDGETLTLFGKIANLYTQIEVPGTLDHLIDELREKYNAPLPGSDLLLSNAYEELMAHVVDVKDLGSGVIGDVECDHLAFRTDEVDWQIWIAQGDHPYPCLYIITSRALTGAPQYSIRVRDWKTGDAVVVENFTFTNSTNAEYVEIVDITGHHELPAHVEAGDHQ